MTTEEFAKNFYLEKINLLKSSFDFESEGRTYVSTKIQELNLNQEHTEKLKHIISSLLTDTFYTVLLGLDGCTSIGKSNQEVFKIYDEQENLISDCGELEAEAFEYFHNHKFEFDNSEADFIATLNYLPTEKGGRTTPAMSKYRPQIKFDIDEMQTSGQQTFIDREIVFPGETINAEIKISSVEHFAYKLTEGITFEFLEGSKLIGTGKIKLIKNEILRKNNR
ncbi:hypothetical protein CLV94_1648 [Flavobacterium endophyticum]|uniref:Translation elongation factor EFTu/EF1A C-terminal domain-containing protein n=1 Tax=Flavobacterium endophyticum TaxID=1540163 RepID=A0A495MMG7_9FLAO|nr:hypothetical protein [Flavobacterium endophyticum]RKS26585.1 hypothetical protein CLV94_1648 [Flavobacterium endophyticum]